MRKDLPARLHAAYDWIDCVDEWEEALSDPNYAAEAYENAIEHDQFDVTESDLAEVIEWRRSQRTKNNTAKISSEIMSVWRRHGAGEAWQTALLWSCGDRAKAARLVSDLDAHAHVRDGILSYGGLSLQDVTCVHDSEPPA